MITLFCIDTWPRANYSPDTVPRDSVWLCQACASHQYGVLSGMVRDGIVWPNGGDMHAATRLSEGDLRTDNAYCKGCGGHQGAADRGLVGRVIYDVRHVWGWARFMGMTVPGERTWRTFQVWLASKLPFP